MNTIGCIVRLENIHLACTNPCSKVTPEEMLEMLDEGTEGGVMGYGEYGNGISCYIQCKESCDALLDVEKMGVPVRDEKNEFVGVDAYSGVPDDDNRWSTRHDCVHCCRDGPHPPTPDPRWVKSA